VENPKINKNYKYCFKLNTDNFDIIEKFRKALDKVFKSNGAHLIVTGDVEINCYG